MVNLVSLDPHQLGMLNVTKHGRTHIEQPCLLPRHHYRLYFHHHIVHNSSQGQNQNLVMMMMVDHDI